MDGLHQVLGQEVLYQNGCYRRVRIYIAGWHPHLGTLHFGWSGQETIVDRDVVMPTQQIDVREPRFAATVGADD